MGKIILNGEEYGSGGSSSVAHCLYTEWMLDPSSSIQLDPAPSPGEIGTFELVIPRTEIHDGFVVSAMPVGGWAYDFEGNDLGYVYITSFNYISNYPSSGTSSIDTCDLHFSCQILNTASDIIYSIDQITIRLVILY